MAESQSNYVEPSPKPNAALADKGDGGYDKALHNRHMQMIAIGGSIGTGLFLGAGGRLAQGGPGLAIAYAVCGFFAFIMVRALGELAIYRPSSGAFSCLTPVSSWGRRVPTLPAGCSSWTGR